MNKIVSARRVVDMPEFYGGGYDLISGRRTSSPSFTKSVWANACMQIRGMELANLPWRIMKGDKIVENHPIEQMLRDFGRESYWEDAMYSTEVDKLQFGAAYWLRDVDTLRRLNPQTIEVKRDSKGIKNFKQVIYKQGGGADVQYFDRDEIVYFRTYHPEDDLGPGVSVVELVQRPINTEWEAELMLQAHFQNDAIPGLLLSTDQIVPQDEAIRIVDWWNSRFRGSRKKGKVGIADRNLKAQVLATTMVESEIIKVREMAKSDICVGFRVSRMLVEAFIDSTYANAGESRRSLIENLIIPQAKMYANCINQDLIPQIDASVRFEFVPEELPIMQEDESEKVIRLNTMLSAGIISPEYFREEMGIEESAKPKEEPDKEKAAEDKWEKKAVKALLRGDDASVPFESDYITTDRKYLISARLSNAKSVDAVRACFK